MIQEVRIMFGIDGSWNVYVQRDGIMHTMWAYRNHSDAIRFALDIQSRTSCLVIDGVEVIQP